MSGSELRMELWAHGHSVGAAHEEAVTEEWGRDRRTKRRWCHEAEQH